MSSPIPTDIQKAAAAVYARLGRGPDADEQTIAAALNAERERCSAFADAVANDDSDRSARGFLTTEEQARRGAGRAIAAAIRAPQPSPTPGA